MQVWGDSFDLYAAPADALNGYWDSGALGNLGAGRFSGSQAMAMNSTSATVASYVKSSGANDAVHHIVFAVNQTSTLTGTTNYTWFTLGDGATAQCSVAIRSDGAILLTSGASSGATLATYTGALTAINTWYAFEIEIVISNTAGSIAIRKNGNASNDFFLGSLNTRAGTANNYANRFSTGGQGPAGSQFIDDLLWRSDASAVPWIGDVRCYTRRPASDAAVQWTPSSPALPIVPFAFNANVTPGTTTARYTPFTPPISGAIGTITINSGGVNAGNAKCSIFNAFGAAPGTPLGSATPVNNAAAGTVTFTFGTPVSVTSGTQYYVGFMSDTAAVNFYPTSVGGTQGQQQTGTSYAAFPTTNPSTGPATAIVCTINITATGNPNSAMVQDAQQDAANSYVYSSTVGQSDRYGISAIGSTPSSIVGVTTRAYVQKSDAGTRNVAVQLQSGATNVQSASTALNTTWQWVSRVDTVDPATGSAWTAVGVNNAQVGVIVTA